MKLNFNVAFPKEKSDLPLLKEVLSKGGFVKPAPGRTTLQNFDQLYSAHCFPQSQNICLMHTIKMDIATLMKLV